MNDDFVYGKLLAKKALNDEVNCIIRDDDKEKRRRVVLLLQHHHCRYLLKLYSYIEELESKINEKN